MESIKFSHSTGPFEEHIRLALVREAIRALPDEHELRNKLQAWANGGVTIPVWELIELERKLVEFDHTNQSELGRLCRLPSSATGRILEHNTLDEMGISSLTVLALALKRFIVLHTLGTTMEVCLESETSV
jgi:hypothetical protein